MHALDGLRKHVSPELDIASQGESNEEARANLVEALPLFFEAVDASEGLRRFHREVFLLRCLLGKLRVVTGSEVCRILEQNGSAAVR